MLFTAARWPKHFLRWMSSITEGANGISGGTGRFRRGSLCSLHDQQIFDVPVGVKVVELPFRTSGSVKFIFIEHQRNLMVRELNPHHFEMIGILTVQEAVPGIAGAGLFVQLL